MSIIFDPTDKNFGPRCICDSCEQPITDVHDALVIYELPSSEEAPSVTRVWLTHKSDVCRTAAHKALGQTDQSGMCDELASHLVTIAASLGLTPDKFTKTYRRLRSEKMIPLKTKGK